MNRFDDNIRTIFFLDEMNLKDPKRQKCLKDYEDDFFWAKNLLSELML